MKAGRPYPRGLYWGRGNGWLLPYLGYKLVPRSENRPYGVAAMIFAGIACDRWTNKERDRKAWNEKKG